MLKLNNIWSFCEKEMHSTKIQACVIFLLNTFYTLGKPIFDSKIPPPLSYFFSSKLNPYKRFLWVVLEPMDTKFSGGKHFSDSPPSENRQGAVKSAQKWNLVPKIVKIWKKGVTEAILKADESVKRLHTWRTMCVGTDPYIYNFLKVPQYSGTMVQNGQSACPSYRANWG